MTAFLREQALIDVMRTLNNDELFVAREGAEVAADCLEDPLWSDLCDAMSQAADVELESRECYKSK